MIGGSIRGSAKVKTDILTTLVAFLTVAECRRFLKKANPCSVFFHQCSGELNHCLLPFERLTNELRLCGILAFGGVKLVKSAHCCLAGGYHFGILPVAFRQALI